MYKISKLLVNRLNNLQNLRNRYIVKDCIAIANDLKKLKIHENHRMITFDIKDLYVNIPIQETLRVTKILLLENNNEHTNKQMITLLEVTLQQNIVHSVITFTNPEKGVSMGSPISNTVAEIFLEDRKHTPETDTRCTFYARYVDGILLIYNTKHTTPEIIHRYINNVHPNLQFTPTFEHNNSISFLDILIIRRPTQIEIDIV